MSVVQRPDTSGHYISNIPDDLWLKVRMKALEEGTSVSAVTIELWGDWLTQPASPGSGVT